MAKNNYLLPFLICLVISVISLGILLFNSPESTNSLVEECETCKICEKCQNEGALVDGVLNSWGENLYDSSEYIINVDVSNFGYEEAKNIDVTCKIYNSDEDGVPIGDTYVDIVTKRIGNVASTSYKPVELTIESKASWGKTPTATCYVSYCDNCTILYERIPDLVEVYGD